MKARHFLVQDADKNPGLWALRVKHVLVTCVIGDVVTDLPVSKTALSGFIVDNFGKADEDVPFRIMTERNADGHLIGRLVADEVTEEAPAEEETPAEAPKSRRKKASKTQEEPVAETA